MTYSVSDLHVQFIKSTNRVYPNLESIPNLFDGLEAESVCFELVGEAGGLGVELVRHVPHTSSKLHTCILD